MSDLSPECAPKRTSADHSEFMGSRPRQLFLQNNVTASCFFVPRSRHSPYFGKEGKRDILTATGGNLNTCSVELMKRGRRRRNDPSFHIAGYDYPFGARRWQVYTKLKGNMVTSGYFLTMPTVFATGLGD